MIWKIGIINHQYKIVIRKQLTSSNNYIVIKQQQIAVGIIDN